MRSLDSPECYLLNSYPVNSDFDPESLNPDGAADEELGAKDLVAAREHYLDVGCVIAF